MCVYIYILWYHDLDGASGADITQLQYNIRITTPPSRTEKRSACLMHYNSIAVRRRLGATPNRVYCRRRCVVVYIYIIYVYIFVYVYTAPIRVSPLAILPFGVRKTELNFTSVSSARFVHTYLYIIIYYIYNGATVAPTYIYRYYYHYYFYYVYIYGFFSFSV